MSERRAKRVKQGFIYIESDSETTDGETDPDDRLARKAAKQTVDDVQVGKCTLVNQESSAIHSPIRMNRIPFLPESENIHTLTLLEILSSDLVETWQINFSIDVQYVLDNIHANARDTCVLHIITAGTSVAEQSMLVDRSDKIHLHKIAMQDQWGTHHSKVMINFFKDNTCQIVVHTANLLRVDWEEKTEAIWLSPRLRQSASKVSDPLDRHGRAFKTDFIHYLLSYKRASIQVLIDKLSTYNFDAIRAIFVSSIPGSYETSDTSCGLARLEHALRSASFTAHPGDSTIIQVSSLGSLGKAFYEKIQSVLNTVPSSAPHQGIKQVKSHFKLIFPTVEDVRDSISGWISGFSLFFNAGNAGGKRQEALSKHHLCRWHAMMAGRARVMPHIKTYARVSADGQEIRWILITSANLSKAALGALESGRIKIKSYEAGVLLTPDLFDQSVVLRPSYKRDNQHAESGTVNIRMAYDLPVESYGNKDQIWSLSRSAAELALDWRGLSLSDLVPK